MKYERVEVSYYYLDGKLKKESAEITSARQIERLRENLQYDTLKWRDDITKLEPDEYFRVKINGEMTLDFNLRADGTWYVDEIENGHYVREADVRQGIILQLKGLFSGTGGRSFVSTKGAFDGSYVSWQCLYMNPLSSFAAVGGDSGKRYVIKDGTFTEISRADGTVTKESGIALETDGAGIEWEPFPYTREQWQALFVPGMTGTDIFDLYDGIFCRKIGEKKLLLLADGDLLLVELSSNAQMGTYLWSVYSLVSEDAMGQAQWEFMPYASSRFPEFRFDFQMDYVKITASCVDGMLINRDETEYKEGKTMKYGGDEVPGWSPMDDMGIVADSAEIHFTVETVDGRYESGTLYVEKTAETEQSGVYTARLVGTGFRLEENEETYGGIVVRAE